jgi:DNA-binding beta-propeller fold protein YncE
MNASGANAEDSYEFVLKIPSRQWNFEEPNGVAVDRSGNVYVADTGNSRIQKFNASGGFLSKRIGGGEGQFSPFGIAVDSRGNYYVAGKSCILKFNESGGLLAKWGSSGTDKGQFSQLFGVAVDSRGNVYVADTYNHRIQKFKPSSTSPIN